MPEHVHIFLVASPDDALSSIARTLKPISSVHIFTSFPSLRNASPGDPGAMVEGMLLRKCRCNHRGERGKVHREPEVEHRRYRVMNCPICGKEMVKRIAMPSGSLPFSTNAIFRFELHTEDVRSCLRLKRRLLHTIVRIAAM